MSKSRLLSILVVVALNCGFGSAIAKDENACISEFLGRTTQLSHDEVDAAKILSRVAGAVGITRKINVVPCHFATQAVAWRVNEVEPGVPKGDYIIYQPAWVRQVLGNDEMQAVALFGHELAHFLNDDFNPSNDTFDAEMERRADKFAGCAVARMDGESSKVEDLLGRLRTSAGGTYPTRLASLAAAKEGFAACSSVVVKSEKQAKSGCNNIWENITITGGQTAISVPEGSRECFNQVKIESAEIGIQVRDRLQLDLPNEAFTGADPGKRLKKLCRIMFGTVWDESRKDFIFPMADDKTAADCAARARVMSSAPYAQMACDRYHSETFSTKGREVSYPAKPVGNCGW